LDSGRIFLIRVLGSRAAHYLLSWYRIKMRSPSHLRVTSCLLLRFQVVVASFPGSFLRSSRELIVSRQFFLRGSALLARSFFLWAWSASPACRSGNSRSCRLARHSAFLKAAKRQSTPFVWHSAQSSSLVVAIVMLVTWSPVWQIRWRLHHLGFHCLSLLGSSRLAARRRHSCTT